MNITRRTMVAATAATVVAALPRARAQASDTLRGWQRSSLYVSCPQGARVAVDVFRPTDAAGPAAGRFPVLLSITQYRRAWSDDKDEIRYSAGAMLELVKEGYVVVVADTIGKGASFGARRGPWCEQEANMAHDLVEWCAAQPWSTGKVGMFGVSYLAGIQYAAAWKKPRGLVTIVPPMVPFDNFDVYFGMIPPRGPFYEIITPEMDLHTLPVDGDDDRALLKAAVAQHSGNQSTGPMPFRDSLSPVLGVDYLREVSPCDHLRELAASGVAIHHIGFWNNWLIRGSVQGFWNCRNPGKLTLLQQSAIGMPIWVDEHRRWFDYWLKGVDNGVMREPRVRYTIANGDPAAFTSSASWPPSGARTLELHLHQGSLQQTPPAEATADTHAVDFDITMANRLSKGSAYVSQPFDDGLTITGHPTMRLWVSSTATDGDFIAYVQDVAPDGSAREITDGRLRASLRALHTPPYRNDGLPWHRAHAQDLRPLQPGRPAELWFELQPIAWRLERGHRLRVLLTHAIPAKSNGADLFNETPRAMPAPVVTIHSSPRMRSLLSLPVA